MSKFNSIGRVVADQTVRGETLLVVELHDETGTPTHNRATGTPYYRVIRALPSHSIYYGCRNPEYRTGTWRFVFNRHDSLTDITTHDMEVNDDK